MAADSNTMPLFRSRRYLKDLSLDSRTRRDPARAGPAAGRDQPHASAPSRSPTAFRGHRHGDGDDEDQGQDVFLVEAKQDGIFEIRNVRRAAEADSRHRLPDMVYPLRAIVSDVCTRAGFRRSCSRKSTSRRCTKRSSAGAGQAVAARATDRALPSTEPLACGDCSGRGDERHRPRRRAWGTGSRSHANGAADRLWARDAQQGRAHAVTAPQRPLPARIVLPPGCRSGADFRRRRASRRRRNDRLGDAMAGLDPLLRACPTHPTPSCSGSARASRTRPVLSATKSRRGPAARQDRGALGVRASRSRSRAASRPRWSPGERRRPSPRRRGAGIPPRERPHLTAADPVGRRSRRRSQERPGDRDRHRRRHGARPQARAALVTRGLPR